MLLVLWVIVGVLLIMAAIVKCAADMAAERYSKTQQLEFSRSDPVVLARAMTARTVRPRVRIPEYSS